MAATKIGQLLDKNSLARLREDSDQNDRLGRAIKEAMPEWVDGDAVAYELLPGAELRLEAPHSLARLLRGILPTLRRNLRPAGIKKVKVVVR